MGLNKWMLFVSFIVLGCGFEQAVSAKPTVKKTISKDKPAADKVKSLKKPKKRKRPKKSKGKIPFSSHFNSAFIASPAQIYQVKKFKSDLSIGYQINQKAAAYKDVETSDLEDGFAGSEIFLSNYFNFNNFLAGIAVDYLTGDTKRKFDIEGEEQNQTIKVTDISISPVLAFNLDGFVFAFGTDVKMIESSSAGNTQKTNYNTFIPAFLYFNPKMEGGIAYKTKTNIDADPETNDPGVKQPAQIITHGRFSLSPTTNISAVFNIQRYSEIDSELYDDRLSLVGAFEMYLGRTYKFDTNLGYNSPYHANQLAFGPDTIATIEFGGNGDYLIGKEIVLGGGFNYEFGSGDNELGDYAKTGLEITLRGFWNL